MEATYNGVRKVIRISHSLLVSIPKDVCESLGIHKGDMVEITIKRLDYGVRYE